MSKFRVSAAARAGFTNYRRGGPPGAGYAWPRTDKAGDGRIVELRDADDDRGLAEDGVLVIGQKTFALLQSDPNLRIVPDGPVGAIGLEIELKKARARIAELEGQVTSLTLQLEAAQTEVGALIADAQSEPSGSAGTGSEKPARKRGRPPGSKNKKAEEAAVTGEPPATVGEETPATVEGETPEEYEPEGDDVE